MVEQTYVGIAHCAIQLGGEAVRRDMDHTITTRHRCCDETLYLPAIGAVMLVDDL